MRRPVTRIDFAIQHHPSRAWCLDRLRHRLPAARIVTDPDPAGTPDAWRTYRRCLATSPADATHIAVIQDDAILCRWFRIAATRSVEARPNDVVVWFVSGQANHLAISIRDAAQHGRSWAPLTLHTWLPIVAVCWPKGVAGLLLHHAETRPLQDMRSDDAIAGDMLRHHRITPWATVPSLCQHLDDAVSLFGTRNQNPSRMASCWIADCDPRGIEW